MTVLERQPEEKYNVSIPSLIEVMDANMIYFGAVVTRIDLNHISSASSDYARRPSLTDHSR